MATIESCGVGVRVRFADGWGGPATVIGRRMRNHAEGTSAMTPTEGRLEQDGPDAVQVRFDEPVQNTPNHKIVAISCGPEELSLLPPLVRPRTLRRRQTAPRATSMA